MEWMQSKDHVVSHFERPCGHHMVSYHDIQVLKKKWKGGGVGLGVQWRGFILDFFRGGGWEVLGCFLVYFEGSKIFCGWNTPV